jgi:hypothetical protein
LFTDSDDRPGAVLVLAGSQRRCLFYLMTALSLGLVIAAVATMGGGAETPAQVVPIRYSHYWPALGGTNCGHFVNGECVSRMASGKRWQDWIGRACACPPEYPFGTRIEVAGQQWICLDRGGKVQFRDGAPFIDFLEPHPQAGHGTIIDAVVTFPEQGEDPLSSPPPSPPDDVAMPLAGPAAQHQYY